MKAKSGDFEFEGTPDEIFQIVSFSKAETKVTTLVPTVAVKEEGKEPVTYTHRGVVEAQFNVVAPEPKTKPKAKHGTRQEQALQVAAEYETFTTDTIMEALDTTRGNAGQIIKLLTESGEFKRVGRGMYKVTAKGLKRVE